MKESKTSDGHGLTKSDLLHVSKICTRLHRIAPNESMINHVHVILGQLLDYIHFTTHRYRIDPFKVLEQELLAMEDKWEPFFETHALDDPEIQSRLAGTHAFIEITQFTPQFKKRSTAPPAHTKQSQSQIWIGTRQDNELLVCTYSHRIPYTKRELSILHMIQPHLDLAWRNWRTTRSLTKRIGVLQDNFSVPSEEELNKSLSICENLLALTPRQREVTELVAAGFDNQQIADQLNISSRTVQKHLEAVYQCVDIHHRTELAAFWHQVSPAL